MKIGGFVGKGTLPFTEQERKAIKKQFKDQLVKQFGEGFFKAFRIQYTENGLLANMLVVRAELATPFNGRNKFLENCSMVTDVCIYCHKHAPKWVEVKKPHSYEVDHYIMPGEDGCPEFDYSCNLGVVGTCKRYRCRNRESIQNWSPFNYGTEIEDLAYDQRTLNGLMYSITPIKPYELAYNRQDYIRGRIAFDDFLNK